MSSFPPISQTLWNSSFLSKYLIFVIILLHSSISNSLRRLSLWKCRGVRPSRINNYAGKKPNHHIGYLSRSLSELCSLNFRLSYLYKRQTAVRPRFSLWNHLTHHHSWTPPLIPHHLNEVHQLLRIKTETPRLQTWTWTSISMIPDELPWNCVTSPWS